MTAYRLEMETMWEGEWRPLGLPVPVTADSPAAALAQVDRPPLRAGVTWRIHITAPDVDVWTEPAQAPDVDVWTEPAQPPDIPTLAANIYLVVAEGECCCGLGVHDGPVEIVGAFYVREHADARAADLLLAAGKRGRTLSVQDIEVD